MFRSDNRARQEKYSGEAVQSGAFAYSKKKRHQGIQAREGPREEGSTAAGDLIGPDVRPSIRPPVCDRTR